MRRIILFVFMVLTTSTCCQGAENSFQFRLYRGYLILAKCSVGGQSGLTAVIDTGTTETILDLKLVQRLSLASWPDSATSLTSDSAARGVSIPDFRLGLVRVEKLDGITMDLSSVGKQLGVRLDVVIGMDVLQRANFTIDYEAQVIRIGPSQALANRAPLAAGPRFVLIDSKVLGQPMRLKVDTGFNGLLLYGKHLEGSAQQVDTGAHIAGVAQTSSVRNVDSPEVRIGNWQAAHIVVSVIDGGPRDLSLYDGLLGPRLFGIRRLSFDFDHHMLYWD